jgi:hypothetical protein
MDAWSVNNKFESIWKEAVIENFQVMFQDSCGATELT